ncbi:MAG: DUF167 domain-containing protein [Alphaproteobacteria bacterium]|nr:MAG: DUF167 domain-containing protein [Alphaproteobacteria bacterium]
MPGAGSPVRECDSGFTLAVRVVPKADRNAVVGVAVTGDGQEVLRLKVTAAPDKGRANTAVVALLAKAWKIPKKSIMVASGATSRHKVLRIVCPGRTRDQIKKWIDSYRSTYDQGGDH